MNEVLTPDSDLRPFKKLRAADASLPESVPEPRNPTSPTRVKDATVRFSSLPAPISPVRKKRKKPKHKSLELEIEYIKQDLNASATQTPISLL